MTMKLIKTWMVVLIALPAPTVSSAFLTLAVGQSVGVERDQRAAGDGEQAERHPGA